MPDNSLERQGLVGGRFYVSRPRFVDLIVGIDFAGREHGFAIGGDELTLTMRDMAVTASLVYPVHWSAGHVYAGGGVGSHSLSYEYRRPRTLSLVDNGVAIPELSTYFGYHALAGVAIDIPHTPIGFFVEGRHGRINLPDADISYNNWSGGIYIMLPE